MEFLMQVLGFVTLVNSYFWQVFEILNFDIVFAKASR